MFVWDRTWKNEKNQPTDKKENIDLNLLYVYRCYVLLYPLLMCHSFLKSLRLYT